VLALVEEEIRKCRPIHRPTLLDVVCSCQECRRHPPATSPHPQQHDVPPPPLWKSLFGKASLEKSAPTTTSRHSSIGTAVVTPRQSPTSRQPCGASKSGDRLPALPPLTPPHLLTPRPVVQKRRSTLGSTTVASEGSTPSFAEDSARNEIITETIEPLGMGSGHHGTTPKKKKKREKRLDQQTLGLPPASSKSLASPRRRSLTASWAQASSSTHSILRPRSPHSKRHKQKKCGNVLPEDDPKETKTTATTTNVIRPPHSILGNDQIHCRRNSSGLASLD
jgi:hypothetical protein